MEEKVKVGLGRWFQMKKLDVVFAAAVGVMSFIFALAVYGAWMERTPEHVEPKQTKQVGVIYVSDMPTAQYLSDCGETPTLELLQEKKVPYIYDDKGNETALFKVDGVLTPYWVDFEVIKLTDCRVVATSEKTDVKIPEAIYMTDDCDGRLYELKGKLYMVLNNGRTFEVKAPTDGFVTKDLVVANLDRVQAISEDGKIVITTTLRSTIDVNLS